MSPQLILFGLIVVISIVLYLYKCVFNGESFTPIIARNLFPLFRNNTENNTTENNNVENNNIENNNAENNNIENNTIENNNAENNNVELLNTAKYETNKKIALNQYGQGKILQQGNYLEMVSKLLKQVSKNNVNVNNLDLTEIDYNGETSSLSNFIQYKMNEIVKKEEYLQQNNGWKFEYFYPKDIKIYYFQEKDSDETNGKNVPKIKVFKLIYTLYNPLRGVSTDCIAFITHTNDNDLEIQYMNILNEWKYLQEDLVKSGNINKTKQNEIFLGSYFEKEFNKSGSSISSSNLEYSDLNCDTVKIVINPDIPAEYKKEIVDIQHLPPSFGSGNVKYPPIYKNVNSNTYSYYPTGPV